MLSLGPPGDIADDGGRWRRLENRRNAVDAEMRIFVNALTVQWMLQDYAHDAPGYVRTLIPPMSVSFALGRSDEPVSQRSSTLAHPDHSLPWCVFCLGILGDRRDTPSPKIATTARRRSTTLSHILEMNTTQAFPSSANSLVSLFCRPVAESDARLNC